MLSDAHCHFFSAGFFRAPVPLDDVRVEAAFESAGRHGRAVMNAPLPQAHADP